MSETYAWDVVRSRAIDRFKETPGEDAERRILKAFAVRPEIVDDLIDRIAERVDSGLVRSGWAVLASECERQAERSTVTAVASGGREKAIARAEQRVRTEFVHYDRWSEIEDELFVSGSLAAFDTPELRQTIHALWEAERPRGEAVEAAAIERGQNYVADRRRIEEGQRITRKLADALPVIAPPKPEPDEPEPPPPPDDRDVPEFAEVEA